MSKCCYSNVNVKFITVLFLGFVHGHQLDLFNKAEKLDRTD